jgi:hypothetical protein
LGVLVGAMTSLEFAFTLAMIIPRHAILVFWFLITLQTQAAELRPWKDYRVILWMGEQGQKALTNPNLPERLRDLDINTGMIGPGGDASFYKQHGFAHYVENIVNEGLCLKFRSNVTNWDQFIKYWMESRDPQALVRSHALEDPAWLQRMNDRVAKTARDAAAHEPLMYDLRDELSTTISANPFDYDFSATSISAFREWLKVRYASLEALNQQWQTNFTHWESVMPFTTDQIKQRMASGKAGPEAKVDWAELRSVKLDLNQAKSEQTRWNFAPWADHRSYMDHALSQALEHFRRASHEADPATPVGIEGTQMPSAFGGYDLWRMSRVLDWVEPYDICNSREIFGSFMPGKPLLATVFEKETDPAMRRLWHLLLEGDKGCIIWWSEDCIDGSKPELPLTAKGQALAPVLKSLQSPLAKLFMLAERERDPILIHYSQPSIQVAWLMESTGDGKTWVRRFSSYESDHNRHAIVRNAWLKALQDLGFSPTFIASEELEKGLPTSPRLLVLPQSWAMSDAELHAARAFSKREHRLVIADGPHGIFDEHGTLRTKLDWPTSEEPAGTRLNFGTNSGEQPFSETGTTLSGYPVSRLKADFDASSIESLRTLLAERGVRAPVAVPAESRVRVHRFKVDDEARLIAFERNVEYKIREELAQVGGNEALEKPVTFKARLQKPGHVVNLRTGESLGEVSEFRVSLEPWQPALFAVLPKAPDGEIVPMLLKTLGSF